jgi:outer membrane PBP1 activator LpoA protein
VNIPGLAPLTTAQLAAIRGGFDLGQGLSIDFAFQQISTVGGTIVQSIMVPKTTLFSTAAGTIPPAAVPVTVSSVSNGSSATNAVTPAPNANLTLTSTANDGMTRIVSNLGAGGISNVVSNQANNAVVGVATTMNIGISGLTPWLNQQQINTNIQNSVYYSNGMFK